MLIITTTFTAPIKKTFYVTEDGELSSRKTLSKIFTDLNDLQKYAAEHFVGNLTLHVVDYVTNEDLGICW